MRVIIPTETDELLGSPRSGHFGHAPWLTIIDLDDDRNVVEVSAVRNAEHGAGGCGAVIAHVMGLGADAIICAGMGMPPLMRFTQAGIAVLCDRTRPTAGEVLDLFLAGGVAPMSPEAACRH